MAVRYISPTGSGLMDGSSPENAGTLSSLSKFIGQAGADGEVRLIADQGTYKPTGQISITTGGTDGHPVTIRGVDSAGNAMDADISGTRPENWSTGQSEGSELFRLLGGANNLHFQDMNISNVGNGAFRIGADISNLTIEHVDANNVYRFVDTLVSGANTTASVSGLTINDVDIAGYSKNAIHIGYNSHDILIQGVTADGNVATTDPYISGVLIDGTTHDVTLRDVEVSNSKAVGAANAYWNGDGFTTEVNTFNIRFENTVARGNTDAGYDLKSSNTVLVNAVADENNRSFRLWSDSITMQDSISLNPTHAGGNGGVAHVWLGAGATVTLENFQFSDGLLPNTLFDLSKGGATLTLRSGTWMLTEQVSRSIRGSASMSSAAFLKRSYSCKRRTSSARGSSSSSSLIGGRGSSSRDLISARIAVRCALSVSRATIAGGLKRQINIELDPGRMHALRVGVNDIMRAVKDENQNFPAGNVQRGNDDRLVEVTGRMAEPGEFADLIVARRGPAPVYLRQVANVVDGQQELENVATLNGERALADLEAGRKAYVVAASIGESAPAVHQALGELEYAAMITGIYGEGDALQAFSRGVAAADRALRALPGRYTALLLDARFRLNLAQYRSHQGGRVEELLAQAITGVQKAIEAAPVRPEARLELLRIYQQWGEAREAREAQALRSSAPQFPYTTATNLTQVGGAVANGGNFGTQNPVIMGGSDSSVNASGVSAPVVRRILTDSSGRTITRDNGVDVTGATSPIGLTRPNDTPLGVPAQAVVDGGAQEGMNSYEMQQAILAELRVISYYLSELPRAINEGRPFLDEPQQLRAYPSFSTIQ